MKNYSDIGLNSKLQKIGGLADKSRKFRSAYEFDATTDSSIISTPKVRKLSFGVLEGGTCNLGGTDNGSGVLSLKDVGGTERVLLDKTGITVTGGSVIVTDDSGGTVLDNKGLVSAISFPRNQTGVLDGAVTTTTSTSLVDINGLTLSSFDIDRDTVMLVLMTIRIGVSVDTEAVVAWIYVGGDVADVQEVQMKSSVVKTVTLTTHNFRTLTASSPPTSYVIKGQWFVTGGTGTAIQRQISYILLGK